MHEHQRQLRPPADRNQGVEVIRAAYDLGALKVQLTPADLSELETAFSRVKVHGGRMNEMQMRIVDQAG